MNNLLEVVTNLRELLNEMQLTNVRYGLKPNIHKSWCTKINSNVSILEKALNDTKE